MKVSFFKSRGYVIALILFFAIIHSYQLGAQENTNLIKGLFKRTIMNRFLESQSSLEKQKPILRPAAEAKLLEVTTMSYSLLPNYNDLFDYTKNEPHSEYIFDIEYEEGMGEGNRLTNAFSPNSQSFTTFYGIGGNGDEQNSPTQELIDSFDIKDKRRDVAVGVTGGFYNRDSVFVKLPTNTNQTYTKIYYSCHGS